MSNNFSNFSQRNGLTPVPGFLNLGELPHNVRIEIKNELRKFFSDCYYLCNTDEILNDLSVRLYDTNLNMTYSTFMLYIEIDPYNKVLDVLEFILNHSYVKKIEDKYSLGKKISEVFDQRRVAYLLLKDGDTYTFYPRASEEEGKAYVSAIENLTQDDAFSQAKNYLLNAGNKLKLSDFAGSIQDSIHALEATSKIMLEKNGDKDLDKLKFSDAIRRVKDKFCLPPALAEAVIKLYGFASEPGIRHCASKTSASNVSEAQAFLLLGTCSSFVTYFVREFNSVMLDLKQK